MKRNKSDDDYNRWMEKNPVRQFRKARGLSIQRFATAIGVSVNTVRSWEQGTNYPPEERLRELADTIGERRLSAHWTEWHSAKPRLL